MQQRAAKCFAALLWGGVLVGGIWLLVRFLLPWTAPFIVAFAAAALMEPGVRSLCRRGLRRSVAAMMMSLAVLTLVSALAVWLSYRGISALTDFAACVPEFIATATSACARAGASLVPSPVMATRCPLV